MGPEFSHPEHAPLLRYSLEGGFQEVPVEGRRSRDAVDFTVITGVDRNFRYIPQTRSAIGMSNRLADLLALIQSDDSASLHSIDGLIEGGYDLLGIDFETLSDYTAVDRIADRAFDRLFEPEFVHHSASVIDEGSAALDRAQALLQEFTAFKAQHKPTLMVALYRRALNHAASLIGEYERRLETADGPEAHEALESIIGSYGQRILKAMANFPQLKEHYGADLVRDFGIDGVRLLMRLKQIQPEEDLELDDPEDGESAAYDGLGGPSEKVTLKSRSTFPSAELIL